MCSDRREYRPSPAPAIAAHGWTPPEGPPARPVWVDLEQLCRHNPAAAATVIDGLDLTGRAPGMLQRWRRSGRGDWLGVVHYSVAYIDGPPAANCSPTNSSPPTCYNPATTTNR